MEQYLKAFKNCLQKEIPFCEAQCPFDFNIRDFIEKSKRGGSMAAFKAYRNSVGFPRIVSEICPQPCKGICPRKDVDKAIDLKLLEKACISFAGNTNPTEYNLPTKKKKIAVIGAGISGLACALRLATKKYEVEILEKSDKIGGILWELMEPAVFLSDIEEQFKFENYVIHLNKKIEKIEDLPQVGYDAVYVATGAGGEDFGLKSVVNEDGHAYCTKHGEIGWFAGGGLIGKEPIEALADGLFMGTIIDNFLKTGNLRYGDRVKHTGMCPGVEKISYEKAVEPSQLEADGSLSFSKEEAQAEALRCVECQCDACRIHCDLTEFYNKWPLRIRDEVMATTLPGSAEVKATPAKRLMSTCSQCGLCKETCPEDIDMGGMILAGRRSMHIQKKAPWAFHDFWLRDMDFSNGEFCALVKTPKGETKSNYAFFPGCQLGAGEPQLVEDVYDYLLEKQPDTGIFLKCCGVPAEWGGQEEKHKEELETLKADWIALGKPTLILACPTCEKKFKEHLKEIPVVSLYEVLASGDVRGFAITENLTESNKVDYDKYEIFHPCATGHEEQVRESVRTLTKQLGFDIPAKENENLAKCCSYGGQPAIANPGYAKFVMDKRIKESNKPYIAYCINCRDAFLLEGKEAIHILELLFSDKMKIAEKDDWQEKVSTISKRQENRVQLKKNLLKNYWGINMKEKENKEQICLSIPEELKLKLSGEKILEADLISVVAFCEKTGRKVYNSEKNSYSGYKAVGYMTYWVEYQCLEDGFELINAYSHRIKIEMEAVWNGEKTNADLS